MKLLCRILGHKWRKVDKVYVGETAYPFWLTGDFSECKRCGETKANYKL